MTTHLALVGEQPMPVLLIDRHLRPDHTVLVCTGQTQAVAARLQRLIRTCEVAPHVAAYELNQVLKVLRELDRAEAAEEIVVNLTGGTKIMMLAAFAHAMQRKQRFVYLESERPPQRLHTFVAGEKRIQQTVKELPTLITVDDYLRAHLADYHSDGYSRDEHGQLTSGGEFEQAVYEALSPKLDEVYVGVKPAGVGEQIEIDMVLRHGNQVAIAEVKLGRGEEGPKKGIDQLSTAGSREYLGTYTRKLLITAGYMSERVRQLAAEKQVVHIQVSGYRSGRSIPPRDAGRLVADVQKALA